MEIGRYFGGLLFGATVYMFLLQQNTIQIYYKTVFNIQRAVVTST